MKLPAGPCMLDIDAAAETRRICDVIREQVTTRLKRRGVVLGLSGGIDSSVSAALCARALGPQQVFGLLMPEKESSPDSLRLGRMLAESLGIRTVVGDITAILSAAGCYQRRDDAIRTVMPRYDEHHQCKIELPGPANGHGYAIPYLVVRAPDGEHTRLRLSAEAYRGIVAATNFKQRVRKMVEYYHADLFHCAVVGTPNRLEYDQGFFVKNGDGAADLKPIAHLYKTQVYALAVGLGIPEEIRRRPATTDTYPLEQSQEEFYFSLPLELYDRCLYGMNHGIAPEELASTTGLEAAQVERVYRQIDSRRKATRYLHIEPLLAGLPGVGAAVH